MLIMMMMIIRIKTGELTKEPLKGEYDDSANASMIS